MLPVLKGMWLYKGIIARELRIPWRRIGVLGLMIYFKAAIGTTFGEWKRVESFNRPNSKTFVVNVWSPICELRHWRLIWNLRSRSISHDFVFSRPYSDREPCTYNNGGGNYLCCEVETKESVRSRSCAGRILQNNLRSPACRWAVASSNLAWEGSHVPAQWHGFWVRTIFKKCLWQLSPYFSCGRGV